MARQQKVDRNAWLRAELLRWFDTAARDLPWRGQGRTPYRVLVSEFMLQQTQVATVIPYFERFVASFPSVDALARADEADVLRHWQGLGYYSRAKRLQAAAKAIVDDHGGRVPRDVATLLTLPGVGRYTAGAIASIAYGVAAPIVDGNVSRVLVRLDAVREDPTEKATIDRLWQRADELVQGERPGDFNSAMMELGATVCVPQNPRCLVCPVAEICRANELGLADDIPPPKKQKAVAVERRKVYRVTDRSGRLLVEQRPAKGRWAGLWQFPTRSIDDAPPIDAEWQPLGRVSHRLTHRQYEFDCYTSAVATPDTPPGTVWKLPAELDKLAMSKPQLTIRSMPVPAEAESKVARTKRRAPAASPR
ncbi:MAG: A/G-specific adenine glycosylase [Planctomycetota bacterium]